MVLVTPLQAADRVTEVEAVTFLVVTVTEPDEDPIGIVTLTGTVAAAVFELVSVIVIALVAFAFKTALNVTTVVLPP